MDGYVLPHAFEDVHLPTPQQLDAFLPPYRPGQVLDPDHPVTIGAMVGPEAFTEVKFLEGHRQLRALDAVQETADRYLAVVGRDTGGLTTSYRLDDADVAVVALGSVLGAAADVVDDLRADGVPVGTLGVTCFRPWPLDEIRAALAGVSRVIVLNRAFSVGSGSILGADVRLSLAAEQTRVYDVVLGLGGRPVTRAVLRRLLDDVLDGQVSDHALSFPDLDVDTVVRELDRGGPDRPEAVTRGELGAHEWGKAWT
jgi:pyruvate ferredoxin oxidoreductase alpha subunit